MQRQFRDFNQKVQSFSLIRIFTDYYLAISKTNTIPTKAIVSLTDLKTAKYGYFDLTNTCKINEMIKCVSMNKGFYNTFVLFYISYTM